MNSPAKRVGLVLKRHDPRVQAVVTDIIPWLHSRGVQVFLEQQSALASNSGVSIVASESLAQQVDVVAVFGGDGTLLYAARLVAASGVPVIGINLGSLGFLTEVKLEEMHSAFGRLLTGEYLTQDRMLLDVEVLRGRSCLARYLALNDAVINKGALARMIELELTVNGQLMTSTRADGLIISSPTGSTAYSLSAGGPVLYPTLGAIAITPICPHTLTNRPVVLPDSVIVEVCLLRGKDVMLTLDGQVGMSLAEQDCFRIRKADATLRLVQSANPFFNILREKLKWE